MYRITYKIPHCLDETDNVRINCRGTNIFDCLDCENCCSVSEETVEMSEDEYVSELKNGNCYITKVDIL